MKLQEENHPWFLRFHGFVKLVWIRELKGGRELGGKKIVNLDFLEGVAGKRVANFR